MAAPALVILAAGESRRLGACKALVRLRDEEPGTPLGLLLAAGALLDEVPPLVVTGPHHAELSAAAPPGVELAPNPDWAAGRTGGIQRAVRLRPGVDLCLAPVDVPLVPAAVFAALEKKWAEAGAPARGWLAPEVSVDGERRFGHPVVVGRDLLAELASWPPARPLRDLREAAEPRLAVAVDAFEILDDLDDPSDLTALRRRFG